MYNLSVINVSFFKVIFRFIENDRTDSNGSMRCFEIHLHCRLSDLQVGETAKVQKFQHLLGVWIYLNPDPDIPLPDPGLRPQGRNYPSFLALPPAV